MEWEALKAFRNAGGGALLMWDKRVVQRIDGWMGKFVMASVFRSMENLFEWTFVGVYGHNVEGSMEELSEEIEVVVNKWGKPICFGGDFNVVRFPWDRSGGSRLSRAM